MSSYQFTVNEDLPFSFEPFLFNQLSQLKKQSNELYLLQLKKGQTCFAIFPLIVHEGRGFSPLRAPFGSFQFDNSIGYEELSFFIQEVVTFAKDKNLESLKIISYPDCYTQYQSQLLSFLLSRNQFEIIVRELNYHIPVEKDFTQHLHTSEERRLKKCLKENFISKIGNGEDLVNMYSLIKACRERKGFPLSTPMDVLKNLFTEFPQSYSSFTLWDKEVLIACAIGVRVSQNILYYFLPADHLDYLSYSPTVLLVKNMYDHCVEEKIQLLDLGIATSGGIPNEGLIRFKENLGGLPSLKLTYQKNLLLLPQ